MLKLFSKIGLKKTGPIGFDLAWGRVNLVQLNRGKNGPVIRSCFALPYPVSRENLLADPPLFKQFVKEALKKGNMQGTTIVTSLPASEVHIIPLTYECAAAQNEEALIVKGAILRIGGDAADFVFDYIPIRSKEK